MTLSFLVTRRKLQLGSRDSTTGWYDKAYAESTVDMIVVPRGATNMPLPAGVYVRLDAVGLTADPVDEGDEIKTDAGVYYEVKGVKLHYFADSFMYRECDLTRLALHELV